MKVIIVLFAVLGLGLAVPHQPKDLNQDFKDILNLIPLTEIRAIAKNYLATDAEFQQVVAYLQGPEWAKLVAALRSNPEWKEFKAYLIEAGIDVEAIIKFIHDLITGAGSKSALAKQTRGIREFLDEVKALIPTKELLAVLNDKLTNSADFQEFYVKVSSEKSQALFEKVRAMEEVQRIAAVLKGFGVDLDKVLAVIYAFLGWE